MNRTDLACEDKKLTEQSGISVKKHVFSGITADEVIIDKKGAEYSGKSQGYYFTMYTEKRNQNNESLALAEILGRIIPDGHLLIAGLGNVDITPDSLGAKTAAYVLSTAQFMQNPAFSALKLRKVNVINTSVTAKTGLETAEYLKIMTKGINPQCVIVIDSLACSSVNRLCNTIQVSTGGISPGSGVSNNRNPINSETLGVPVVAVGVPVVMDMSQEGMCAMVTPRDIDVIIRHYARVISSALNKAANPMLSSEETQSLLY